METYITEHNSRRLVFDMDKANLDINQEIFRIDFCWFGDYEVKEILAFKLLYEDPEEFFRYYKKRKPIDTKTYVFEGKQPAYHKNKECDRLLSSFQNFKIPKEIRERGLEAIETFRNWFKENYYLIETDRMDIFLERLRIRFNLEQKPEAVDYENSGVVIQESLELLELDWKIEEIINKANDFYIKSAKNRIILDNFGKISFIFKKKQPPYNNSTYFSNEEIWEVLEHFDVNFKSEIKFLLKEYYRVKYNPELEFKGLLLDQLGFKPCGSCFDDDSLRSLGQNTFLDFENEIEQKPSSLEVENSLNSVASYDKDWYNIEDEEYYNDLVSNGYDDFSNIQENNHYVDDVIDDDDDLPF